MPDASDPLHDPAPESPGKTSSGEPPRIGPFRITGVVSRGETSSLYRAADDTLERDVALKVIEDPELASRLVAEAKATSKLHHPAIASVYSAGVDPETGVAYVAYEWVEGIPLRSRLRGSTPYVEFLRVAGEIASAVAHAHDQGFVHGDLKADNVVLTLGEESVKLVDFGLSTSESAPQDDPDDAIWGTPAYMAPELFDGTPRTVSTDLFALGVLLYELATGELPFGGADGNEDAVRRAHGGEVRSPSDVSSEIPLSASGRIESLVARDPASRGPSAAEIARWAQSEYAKRHRTGTRWIARIGVPFILAVGIVAWWGTRDDATSAADRTPSGVALAVLPANLRVGTWFDERGEPGPDVDQAVALLRLFLNGRDPGSAVLSGGRSGGETERAAWLCGTWGREGDGLAARFVLSEKPNTTPGIGATIVTADEPVALARAVAEHVAALDLAAEIEVATTLGTRVESLDDFVRAIEQTRKGRIAEARDVFAQIVEVSPELVEAFAWERACALALGDVDGARWPEDRPAPTSSPGAVIAAAIGVPKLARDARWGAAHSLAQQVDLMLDIADPRATDAELLERLATVGRADNPVFARRAAEIALHRKDPVAATSAAERLQVLVGEHDPELQLLKWRIESLSEAPDTNALFRWLAARDRDPNIRFGCTVGIDLAGGEFARAVSTAQTMPPDPSNRSRVAAAHAFALFGDPAAATRVALDVVDPLDPGLGARTEAAALALTGDTVRVREALGRASRLEADRPETVFLKSTIDAEDLAEIDIEEAGAESEFERFRRPFRKLVAGRRLREAADAEGALQVLSSVGWTRGAFQPVAWPEVVFLARLEEIDVYLDVGDIAAATTAWEAFRSLGAPGRFDGSRIGRRQEEIGARLQAPDRE